MDPKKILVVEDHPAVRQITAMMLAAIFPQAEIFQAENGEIGWEQFQSRKPDLVITDHEMPILTGIGLLRKIKAADASALVVMVSANNDPVLIKTAEELGAYFFLKPFGLSEMREMISKI